MVTGQACGSLSSCSCQRWCSQALRLRRQQQWRHHWMGPRLLVLLVMPVLLLTLQWLGEGEGGVGPWVQKQQHWQGQVQALQPTARDPQESVVERQQAGRVRWYGHSSERQQQLTPGWESMTAWPEHPPLSCLAAAPSLLLALRQQQHHEQ